MHLRVQGATNRSLRAMFRLVTILGLLSLGAFLTGCSQPKSTEPELAFEWKLKPTPPQTGLADCTLVLKDEGKKPVTGAKVKLEGNMSHPGMQPSLAQLKETAPGTYAGKLNFTMGGDWFVLVDATLSDGRVWHKQIDVPGVKSR